MSDKAFGVEAFAEVFAAMGVDAADVAEARFETHSASQWRARTTLDPAIPFSATGTTITVTFHDGRQRSQFFEPGQVPHKGQL